MVAAVLMATTRLLLAPEHNCAAALGYATTYRPSLLLSTQGPSAPGDQVASMMLARQPTHGSVGSIHSSVSALSCGSLPRRLLGIGSMVLVAASRRGALGGGMGMGMPAAARHEWIAHDGFAPAMVGEEDMDKTSLAWPVCCTPHYECCYAIQ